MQNDFLRLAGVEFPVVAFSHCRDVVAAVSRAGGLGVLGAAAFTPEQLELELRWIDDNCGGRPYGVNVLYPFVYEEGNEDALRRQLPERHAAFTAELLERFAIPPPRNEAVATPFGDAGIVTREGVLDLVEVALRHPIRLLVSALGPLPADVRDEAAARGALVGGMVGSARHAIRHVEAGADVVVAQGVEAAGHTGEIATMVLVPEVVDAVPGTPVLAAGGIATGRQIAAALALGAQGVWIGSAWLTTIESDVDPLVKERLLRATSGDTVKTRCISGKPMRLLRNPWSDAWEAEDAPEPLRAPLQGLLVRDAMVSIYENRVEPLMTSAVGQVVGQLRELSSAELLLRLMEELVEAVAAVERQLEEG